MNRAGISRRRCGGTRVRNKLRVGITLRSLYSGRGFATFATEITTETPMAGMDDVPRELLHAAYKRNPVYLLKIPLLYGLWGAATFVLYRTQASPFAIPIGIACSIFIAYLIRGLGAIAHDAVHGNCSRSKTLSYWIALLCWAPTGMSVTLYTNYHLHHHRIANTYPDVDNFVVTDYTRNPVLAKALLFVVYTVAYPLYWLSNMPRYMKRLTPGKRVIMNVELLGFAAVMVGFFFLMPLQVFVFFYGVPFLFGSILAWNGPLPAPPRGAPGPTDAHWGHTHAMTERGGVGQLENGWGDCCGIPVPSAFAAAQAAAAKKPGARLEGPGIRPVPFD